MPEHSTKLPQESEFLEQPKNDDLDDHEEEPEAEAEYFRPMRPELYIDPDSDRYKEEEAWGEDAKDENVQHESTKEKDGFIRACNTCKICNTMKKEAADEVIKEE